MKLEFLESGAPDCPLIRLYAFDAKEAAHFREILRSLSPGIRETVDLHSDPGVEAIDKCRLTLHLGQHDFGIIRSGNSTFDCVFTTETWRNIEDLVEPFCEVATQGSYQWLAEQGDAVLLLSTDGSW